MIAYFATAPTIAAEWRLIIITEFCGDLTTFSTFSAEVVALLQQGRMAMAGGIIAIHVIGSVTMTLLGIGSLRLGQWSMIQLREIACRASH